MSAKTALSWISDKAEYVNKKEVFVAASLDIKDAFYNKMESTAQTGFKHHYKMVRGRVVLS